MEKHLENEIDLKFERAFRSFTEKALKGEGGLCNMQHTIIAQGIKKCVEDKLDEAMTEQKNDQLDFYRKMLWTGVAGLFLFFFGQIILKLVFK